MSSDPNDADQKPPVEEDVERPTRSTSTSIAKWLAIIFFAVPVGLIVIVTLVFGICMLASR